MLQGSAGAIPADEMRTAAKARKVRLGRPPLGRPMFPPSPVTCWTIRGSRRRGLERERRANAGRTAATSPRAACRARAPALRRSPLGRTPAPPLGPRPRSSGTPSRRPPRRSERGPRQCRLASSAFERVVDVHPHRPFPPSQASNAAADWAQKRKQALERATELRAQRKAAERASQLSSAEPVRGLESDPLPPPRSDDAAADPAWWEVHSGPAPAKGDPEDGALPGRHRRARWGELPRDGANGDAPGARVVKKENRDPSTPSPESEIPRLPPAGRLMPWEQQMLIERAEREAAAKGLPPTPSKEVIARAFGEEEPDEGRDPDVWAPPPPPPASSARNNPTTSATAALAARRAKEAKAREEANERAKEAKEAREKAKKPPAEKDQSDADRRRIEGGSSRAANRREPPPPSSNAGPVGAAPAEATVVRAAPVPDRKKPVGGGSRPTPARPASARPGSARRSPYAAAAVPGFAAAHEKQTRAAAIKPVDPRPVGAPVEQQRSERTEKKQHAPGPGSTPAVARAAAAASAEILGALSPEPTKPKPAVAADSALAADAAQEDLFPVHVVSRGRNRGPLGRPRRRRPRRRRPRTRPRRRRRARWRSFSGHSRSARRR